MSPATDTVTGLHLILGDEELLVERAVGAVLRQARAAAGTADVPVDRLRAGEVSVSELAELLSPSLFADERVVVLEAAAEAGKEAVGVIESAAADLPPGTLLVVVHSGAGGPRRWPTSSRSWGPRCTRALGSPRRQNELTSCATSFVRCASRSAMTPSPP